MDLHHVSSYSEQRRGVQRPPAAREHLGAAVQVDGAARRRATGSTAPPTTRPDSRSARSCAPRSAASTRPSATRRTRSRWCRRLKARWPEVHSMLRRVRDLAVQYNNGTLSASDKTSIEQRGRRSSAPRSRASAPTRSSTASRCSPARRPSPSRSAPTTARRSPSHGAQPVRRRRRLLGRLGDLHRLLDDDAGRRSTPRSRTSPTTRATFGSVQNRHRAHAQQPRHLRGEPARPPRAASATSTWRPRWSSSRSTRSSSRPAPRCSPRRTRCRRPCSACSAASPRGQTARER